MASRKSVISFFIMLLFVLSCARVPYTERQQFMTVSESEDARIGETTFEQIKAESRLSSDPRLNAVIKETGQRIAAAADKPEYQWEFIVIEDKSANAFALPGGKVAFYTGIMPVARDEAGIATVMGHEVAHVLARHGAERLSQSQILNIGQAALMVALIGKSPVATEAVMQAYGLGAQVGVLLPYSRKHEAEADKIGLILMAKAGYDPRQSVEFWKRMSEQFKGPRAPELLSTHPNDQSRIEELEAFIPTAMEYYNDAIAANPGLKRHPKQLQ